MNKILVSVFFVFAVSGCARVVDPNALVIACSTDSHTGQDATSENTDVMSTDSVQTDSVSETESDCFHDCPARERSCSESDSNGQHSVFCICSTTGCGRACPNSTLEECLRD
jgi:hypothetical protein